MLKKMDTRQPFVSHSDLIDILEKGAPMDFREGMRQHLASHFMRLFG
jgi:DNA-binding FadR family transcriptional regulator